MVRLVASDPRRPLLIGAHLSIEGGVSRVFGRGAAVGCACAQIFIRNARQWQGVRLSQEEARLFRSAQRESSIRPVWGHANYLINLAASDRTIRRRSLTALEDDLRRCDVLGLPGVVVHPGSHGGRGTADGISRVTAGLCAVLDRTEPLKAKVVLETSAGQGNGIGARFEELADILVRVGNRSRTGVCFDTCHVFAAGYDLRTRAAYERTWATFCATIGMQRLKIIHVNDCKGDLGHRSDRHEHIGRGCLGTTAFRLLMRDQRLVKIPKVVETPKGKEDDGAWDRRNVGLLRKLAGSRA